MYCESRHEAHKGRMFANMALVVLQRVCAEAYEHDSCNQQLKVPPSHVHTVTLSPKPQTVEFMYVLHTRNTTGIFETQLHGSRAGETPSTEDTRFARFDCIQEDHTRPRKKNKNIEYWRPSPPYCVLDYDEFFLTVQDYSKCSTLSHPLQPIKQ